MSKRSSLRLFSLLVAALAIMGAAAGAAAQLVVPGTSNAPPAQQTPTAQTAATQTGKTAFSADLPGETTWKDTGVDLAAGDRVEITASGQLQYSEATQPAGPDGLPRGWKDLLRMLPVNDVGRGALLARIGDTEASQPFVAGAKKQFSAPVAGRLFLGINQMSNDRGNGSYHVEVRILGHATGAAAQSQSIANTVPGFTLALLDKIPRRITDQQGDLGDMTNFILIGSEERLRHAFEQAGWVLVDRTKQEAVLHGILASVTKQAYVQMPMSELYLFDRPQDYGFALAEPFEVVFQRHHNRWWKSPYTVNGQTVWVGAGTHDIGLERDQRNNGITHKIDANVDNEREFVGQSLSATGMIAAKMYMTPSHPIGETKTATGGSFHSDGRVLVMELRGSSAQRGAEFAGLFCSVLENENPDGGPWGPCAKYIETPPANRPSLARLPTNYRLAIVPGVLSSCATAAPAFKEGQEHLRTAHGMTVDLIPAPNRSSAENGKDIAQFLKESYAKDGRKFIVLGYSKGAPDVMEGLANDADATAAVAAFVTVAGAVAGSPVANLLPAQAEQWIKAVNLSDCQGDLNAAFQSLRRDVRAAFLSQHPSMGVPVYSVAAISQRENTSKVLLESWALMSVYGPRQDSQLLDSDAIYPGGNSLGAILADHWAVALPFEDSTDTRVKEFVDHNHYPRTALLEALVRLITADLQSPGGPPGNPAN
jgi:hypothetical protein